MRRFVWCAQEFAEFCHVTVDHIHVCITTPKYRAIRPGCGKDALNLSFHDLDPAAIRRTAAFEKDSVRGQELIDGCFTESHAEMLVAFVGKSKKTVVVNCEAGISRSPAVVLALRRKFGGDPEECFKRACPNIHVASVLGKVLGVGPFQARPYRGIVDPFAEEKAEWQKEKGKPSGS
jgi:hypothetical protein